jgi:hypothetical protein
MLLPELNHRENQVAPLESYLCPEGLQGIRGYFLIFLDPAKELGGCASVVDTLKMGQASVFEDVADHLESILARFEVLGGKFPPSPITGHPLEP